MARPALATVDELQTALGEADPITDEDQAGSLLERASEIVRAEAHKTWLNDDEDDLSEDLPGQIPGVVVSMVERASRNPTGTTQEQAGPFSRSFGPAAADRLFLTKWERKVIAEAAGQNVGLGTIGTTRGPLETSCAADDLWPEEVMETIPWPS